MHESERWKWSHCRARLLATPWIAAHQAPPSIGFSRVTSKFLVATVLHIERNTPCFYRWLPQSSRGLDGSHFESLSLLSVQFSRSVMSNSLWPHGLQHNRPPCPSSNPGVYSNSCPLSWWCHPTISSSVIPFSSCLQSFPASGSFQMSQLFASGGQSIKSFSFSTSPSKEYSGLISFRMDWLDLLAVQGTLKSLLQHHSSKASILRCSAFFIVQLSHPYMTTGKTIALTRQTFVGKVMSLLFNMLSS